MTVHVEFTIPDQSKNFTFKRRPGALQNIKQILLFLIPCVTKRLKEAVNSNPLLGTTRLLSLPELGLEFCANLLMKWNFKSHNLVINNISSIS